MRVTRSAAASLSTSKKGTKVVQELVTEVSSKKRKAKTAAPAASVTKKARTKATDASSVAEKVGPLDPHQGEEDLALPAVLSFDFEEAKKHLITTDARWEDIFARSKCKPFENLDHVHPFRALATSILGQQISWLAARSIQLRFIRLFNPEVPEIIADYEASTFKDYFPSAAEVCSETIPVLRTAGLSQRKAEYIHDLAHRFADGRLSSKKLLEATDEELAEMLIAVRGIGQWTVDMFAIFSMRRPNILPVGDLGVQRGVLRWFVSQHLPSYKITVEPKKERNKEEEAVDEEPTIPTPPQVETIIGGSPKKVVELGDVSVILPVTPTKSRTAKVVDQKVAQDEEEEDEATQPVEEDSLFPTPFTPSINRTLARQPTKGLAPLPAGLTATNMKSRLDTKKKIKGALLTPTEMTALTESWEPYRSIAVYYMWALADGK